MMNIPIARISTVAWLLALSLPSVSVSQERPPTGLDQRPAVAAPSDLGFLEIGRAYYIKFPDDRAPVLERKSEITQAYATTEVKGQPESRSERPITASWSMTYRVTVFVVRKLGGGSWALLEHPTDPEAALEIMSARRFLADEKYVKELKESKDQEERKRLEELRKDAARKLKMTQTWINLAHAISISDPPPDSNENWKINVEIK